MFDPHEGHGAGSLIMRVNTKGQIDVTKHITDIISLLLGQVKYISDNVSHIFLCPQIRMSAS